MIVQDTGKKQKQKKNKQPKHSPKYVITLSDETTLDKNFDAKKCCC